MLFNSIDFAIFLPIVFGLYWFVTYKNLKWQNLLIVFASYLFYGWWDWRFLSLILFSTLVDFVVGLALVDEKKTKKRLFFLWVSILVNIGLLGFFKYYNFFLESFTDTFLFFGKEFKADRLNIVLPVGISFYTFQTLSYSIDVYRKKLKPTKNFVAFAAFVSFFPQLVAGPIERASNLLPQFYVKRKFEYTKAIDGLRQMLWGFFKKIIIADNAALIVNAVYANYQHMPTSSLWLAAILFSFQIYGDFSGYSDIAIGTAKLFGFNLSINFKYPYFSRDIAEFWRKWHISLTTWFRDYIYIPLGGSRVGKIKTIRNVFIIFLVSGFWHGANWTFIAWGFLHALLFLPLLLRSENRKNINEIAQGGILPSIKEFFQMGFTFILTMFLWVFFRSESIADSYNYLVKMFDFSTLLSLPSNALASGWGWYILLLLFIGIEWFARNTEHGLSLITKIKSNFFRKFTYVLFILILIYFSSSQPAEFIYFQF